MEVASASSALSLAGNVYQFVQFSSKLCNMFLDIQKTANGMTRPNANTQARIKLFLRTLERLNTDLHAYSPVLSGADKNSQLAPIMQRCEQIAGDLLRKLKSLQVKGKKTMWKAVVATVKSFWEEDEIQKLEDELHKFREELEWIMMLSVRSDLSLVKKRQKYRFNHTQDVPSLTGFIWPLIKELPEFPIPQTMQISGQIRNINAIPNNTDWYLAPQTSDWHQRAAFDASKAMAEAISLRLVEIDHQILESLKFLVMPDRVDAVSSPAVATFDWIFHDCTANSLPWTNFSSWLAAETTSRVYWINGKAGSGKSTMMKYLFSRRKTRLALGRWAKKSKLVLARFFFSFNGEDLQKSQEGLLRALLHACLNRHRELIPLVVPYRMQFGHDNYRNHWSLVRLQEAFQRLMSQTRVALKFCFFIDGLDEYAGDLREITSMLMAVAESSHVKICTSSRPLPIFEESLSGLPGLVLHDLTRPAIQHFVSSSLNLNKNVSRLEEQEPGWVESMAKDIASEASGVFLWVKLVMGSLLQGLCNNDKPPDLRRRLTDLPEDLGKLYLQMIQRVNPPWYLEEGFRLLLLVKAAGGSIDILTLYFAETKVARFAKKGPLSMEPTSSVQEEDCRGLIERMKTRCMGLLEVCGSPGEVMTARVTFSHKSVGDFLNTETVKMKIKEHLRGPRFIPEVKNLRGILWRLKTHHTRQQTCANLERSEFFDHICPLVNEFMKIARKAEALTRHPHIKIVDELNRVVSALWATVAVKSRPEQLGLIHWTIAPGNTRDYRQSRSRDAQLSWTSALGSIRRTRHINFDTVTTDDTGPIRGIGNHVDSNAFAFFAKERGLRLYSAAKGL